MVPIQGGSFTPAGTIREKTMVHRIEIGFKEGIRDALGEKI